ncbi:Aste57867_17272 [Aphanomyces stellatus]|uniref:Elicitin n=1 Tax=Aphanomyces stellatus TaxID=120398 RepID=A0A485L7J7_9STRA|nr:hypothetical protein As57867_017213 [Aphanomyces stellatus]VFT94028.1 Aste57867_17272 [Aphanomyces stellatus]
MLKALRTVAAFVGLLATASADSESDFACSQWMNLNVLYPLRQVKDFSACQFYSQFKFDLSNTQLPSDMQWALLCNTPACRLTFGALRNINFLDGCPLFGTTDVQRDFVQPYDRCPQVTK